MVGRFRFGYLVLIAVVGAVVLLGSVLSPHPEEIFRPQFKSIMGALWLFPALVWVAIVALTIVHRRFDQPTKAIVRVLFGKRRHLALGVALTFMTGPFLLAFGILKNSIPLVANFYADHALVALDRAIFGVDPWRITHAMLGPDATLFLDSAYLFWFAVMFLTIGWLNFSTDRAFQLRGLLTFYLSWTVLGLIAAASFASVGPCFYADFYGNARFQPLLDNLQGHAPIALTAMNYLRTAQEGGALGAGISAMPSLHVAMAVLLFILVREKVSWRPAIWMAGAYVAVIFVASVHLGWHYAIDGIVAAFGVQALWLLAGRIVGTPHHSINRMKPFLPAAATVV